MQIIGLIEKLQLSKQNLFVSHNKKELKRENKDMS